MTHAKTQLSREDMEWRRLAGAKDLANQMKQSTVARTYGVSRTTVSRWASALKQGGPDALRARRGTGRPRLLTPGQLAQVGEMYRQRPCTTTQLAERIERAFGVHYNPDHVGRILRHWLGFPRAKVRKAARGAV